MGDIALVFHWAPADMDPLSLSDLIEWRENARIRWEQTHGA
ncbi:GpE family phage tail protein [Pseudomonas sp. BN415]|nr:GpE family phage tail protein [Pseudomonas sp. BN415]MDH4585627.1 GpE family phage tail protein [Pseudomonas sp. BN415]